MAARRGGDYVPREQHEQLEIEMATVKEQLIECLEELNSRELELTEVRLARCHMLYYRMARYSMLQFGTTSVCHTDWVWLCVPAPTQA